MKKVPRAPWARSVPAMLAQAERSVPSSKVRATAPDDRAPELTRAAAPPLTTAGTAASSVSAANSTPARTGIDPIGARAAACLTTSLAMTLLPRAARHGRHAVRIVAQPMLAGQPAGRPSGHGCRVESRPIEEVLRT